MYATAYLYTWNVPAINYGSFVGTKKQNFSFHLSGHDKVLCVILCHLYFFLFLHLELIYL